MRFVILLALVALLGCQSSQPSPDQLVAGLAGPNGVEYFALLRQQADEDPAREAIVSGLASPNVRVRGQCARLLASRRDVTVVEPLRPLLHDKDPTVRWNAAKALVPLVETRELVSWLQSPTLEASSKLVLARAMLLDPAELTESAFVDWLLLPSHPEPFRTALYRAQLDFHAPRFGRGRGEESLLEPVAQARVRLAAGVRRDVVDDKKPEDLRSLAVLLYGSLGGGAALNDILSVEKTAGVGTPMHLATLLAMGRTENPGAIATLAGYATDMRRTPEVRGAAVQALGGLVREPAAQAALLPLLTAAEPALRAAAAQSLRGSKNRRVIAPLQAALAGETDPQAARSMQASIAHLSRSGARDRK